MMNVHRSGNAGEHWSAPGMDGASTEPGTDSTATVPTDRFPTRQLLRPYGAARLALTALTDSIPPEAENVTKKTWSTLPLGAFRYAKAAVSFELPPTPENPNGVRVEQRARLAAVVLPTFSESRLKTASRVQPMDKKPSGSGEPPKRSLYQRFKGRFTGE